MKKILMTPEGKKVVIDVEKDEEIYSAPRNPPNTGTTYTSGTDLYRHVARSGNEYFYFYNWSMWQGTESSVELATRNEVERFLVKKAGSSGWDGIDDSDGERFKELGFDIYDETA